MQQIDLCRSVNHIFIISWKNLHPEKELHNYRLESLVISFLQFVACHAKLAEWKAIILGVVTFNFTSLSSRGLTTLVISLASSGGQEGIIN